MEALDELVDDPELAENAAEYRSKIKSAGLDIRYEVETLSEFSMESYRHLEDFLYILEEVLKRLDEIESPSDQQIKEVKRARKLYHEKVWPWIAMQISVSEAEGPKNDLKDFNSRGEIKIEEYEKTHPEKVDTWETGLEHVDILPEDAVVRLGSNSTSSGIAELGESLLDPGVLSNE